MATVLIVDDEADVRAVFADALASEGFQVRVACDGADAFAALERGPLPDAIVLDLGMPNMTGWQFRDLQKRHASFAHIPVVVVTGQKPLGIDAAGVLQKPFPLRDLSSTLRRVLASDRTRAPRPAPRWARVNAPPADAAWSQQSTARR
jgi:CheY-like chemotaxis protein